MTASYLPPVLLSSDHGVDGFECRPREQTLWLRRYARHSAATGATQVLVVTPTDSAEVVAYYAWCMAAIAVETAPPRLRRGAGRYPQPVALLARLGVSIRHERRGLGAALLRDVIARTAAVGTADPLPWVVGPRRGTLLTSVGTLIATQYSKYGYFNQAGSCSFNPSISVDCFGIYCDYTEGCHGCQPEQRTVHWPYMQADQKHRRNQRIEVSATPEDRALIDGAVAGAATGVTELVLSSVTTAAQVLADRTEFVLSPEAGAVWEQINKRPARDLSGLRELMKRPSPSVAE